MSTSHLILGKVRSYGIEFGCRHWRRRLVEQIVCSIYWQQSLWAPRRKVSLTGTGHALFGWQPHCAFATSEPLSNQKETVRRVSEFKDHSTTSRAAQWLSLLIWQWTTTATTSFLHERGAYHHRDTGISKGYKKARRFGLTKAVLAEGDASFPFAGHCHISLRRTLLLRKVMRAQSQRELQEESTGWTINMS